MNIDPTKVQVKLSELNSSGESNWIAAEGYYTLTKLTFGDKNEVIFHSGSGMPLKAFVNTKTGEIKVFHINNLMADSN